jgi:hypothetical protein
MAAGQETPLERKLRSQGHLPVNDHPTAGAPGEGPDEISCHLRNFDSAHSLMQVVDSCGQDDLET